MTKSKAFFVLCLSFIAGIAAHSFFSPEKRIGEPFWWYVGFLGFVTLGTVLVFSHWKVFGIWCLGFGIFSLGLFRYSQTIPTVDEQHILHYVGQEVTVRGVIDGLPRLREKTVAYVVRMEERQGQSLLARTVLGGKLLLTAEPLPRYKYGDTLTFTCTPTHLNKYEQYARREGVHAACLFPEYIAAMPPLRGDAPPLSGVVRGKLYQIRQSFHARLTSLFLDPYGALLAGLLYGDTSGFSLELKDAFRFTGISHITALSGYNVTILAHLLISLLVFLWLTRKQALPIAFVLIIIFVVLTGAEASVVRAAVMGFLLLGAKGIGRLGDMRIALAFAGAVMLAVNPFLLRFDLGFQLSFAATIALLWFADDIAQRTWMRYLPSWGGVREAGSASAAAILMTAPFLLHATGMIGPLSLVANILVVPVVPFAMGAGFLAVAADFALHPAGVLLSWGARVLLGYIVGVAEYFARFGAVHLQVRAWAAWLMMGAIVIGIWWWKRENLVCPAAKRRCSAS